MSASDTIFALATAAGKAGVAVIRVSGSRAGDTLRIVSIIKELEPNRACYTCFRDGQGSLIDRGLAIYFKAPHSFTGEDVVELQIHGSFAVINELLELLASLPGLRHAEAGEFTRRAFIYGKMDLIEAEGLDDLIDAGTREQKSQALRQMDGALSRYYEGLRRQIITALAHLEAYIDFPDEEIPESVLEGLGDEVRAIEAAIAAALADDRRGQALRDGLRIVIVGAPNAGKSSLLNCLAKRDAAIVSQHAGTTRDVIEVQMDLGGFPVILTDTAGIREGQDEVESEGIRRALMRAREADIKLALFDGCEIPILDFHTLELVDEDTILVITKADIADVAKRAELPELALGGHYISTTTGEGVAELLCALEKRTREFFHSEHAPMITRNRHRALLADAANHLNKYHNQQALELACEELRQSALSIGKITGKIEVDDVLDVIFHQFCIGK